MSGDVHVRFCERPGVRLPRATHPIVHCRTEAQAQTVLRAIGERFEQCGLVLHPTKTRIVYCKDSNRLKEYEHVTFDFLGFTFQPRQARNRQGQNFSSFLPAMSTKSATHVRQTIREWRLASTKNHYALEDLPRLVDPVVRGWMQYYGRYYRTECVQKLQHLNEALAKWAQRKHKRFRHRPRASRHWLRRIARRNPQLFALWHLGVKP